MYLGLISLIIIFSCVSSADHEQDGIICRLWHRFADQPSTAIVLEILGAILTQKCANVNINTMLTFFKSLEDGIPIDIDEWWWDAPRAALTAPVAPVAPSRHGDIVEDGPDDVLGGLLFRLGLVGDDDPVPQDVHADGFHVLTTSADWNQCYSNQPPNATLELNLLSLTRNSTCASMSDIIGLILQLD
jgi:hypothetical protein